MVLKYVPALLVYFGLALSSSVASAQATVEKGLVEKLLPLSEKRVVSSDKEKILYFWATWCSDCKEKLTTVFKRKNLFEKYDIYLVATDKDKEKIAHFQKKHGLDTNIYYEDSKELQKKLRVFGVPTLIKMEPRGDSFVVTVQQTGGDIEQHLQSSSKE